MNDDSRASVVAEDPDLMVRTKANLPEPTAINYTLKRPASQTQSGSTDGSERPSKRRKLDEPVVEMKVKQLITSSSETSSSRSYASSHGTEGAPQSKPVLFCKPLSFDPNGKTFVFSRIAPSTSELLSSVDEYGIPSKMYTNPYYSRSADAPGRPREYAGLVFTLHGGTGLNVLEDWKDHENRLPIVDSTVKQRPRLDPTGVTGWEYAGSPPSSKQVREWMRSNQPRGSQPKPKQTSQARSPRFLPTN